MSRPVDKARRKQILEDFGLKKSDMDKLWEKWINTYPFLKYFRDSGITWKDLYESQIRTLLRSLYKPQTITSAERNELEPKFIGNMEITISADQIDTENIISEEDSSDNSILYKIDHHIPLSECELEHLVFEHDIETISGKDHRWQKEMKTISELGGRTFLVYWMSALTEMQEDSFDNQPIEVKKVKTTRLVTEEKWVDVCSKEIDSVVENEADDLISRKTLLDLIQNQQNIQNIYSLVKGIPSVFSNPVAENADLENNTEDLDLEL